MRPPGRQPEFNDRVERSTHRSEARHYTPHSAQEQAQLDSLLDAGFVWEEAVMLLTLREHLYDNSEVRQRMADDPRLLFARWLYLNHEMHEDPAE